MNTHFRTALLAVTLTALLALAHLPAQAIDVTRTTCEFAPSPLALTTATPRLGWQLSGPDGCMQSAYQVEVYTLSPTGERRECWDSGKVLSAQSQLVTYDGAPLERSERYYWRVRAWDEQDQPSAWSAVAEFRLAPAQADLDASQWIGAITQADAKFPKARNYHEGELRKPDVKEAWDAVDSLAWRSILLRREFAASKTIADATLHICGLGHYELTLNGQKVGDAEFTPLWSDYDKTAYYNTFDVTAQLQQGQNAIGVLLGNGFYNMVGAGRYRKLQIGFGPETLLLRLVVRYTDGTQEVVLSDGDWRYDLSPITFHSIYGGEDYDARMEQPGWDRPGFDDSAWQPVVVQERPQAKLRPQPTTPVKIMQRFGVVSSHKLTAEELPEATQKMKREVDPSAIVLDMGQNLAGFPEIKVKGKKGQTITLLVGESTEKCGAVSQRQTGRPYYFTYTLKGEGEETWHPRFSYYGYRYIQVEGAVLKGQKNPDRLPVIRQIQSCFVSNSAADAGSFTCSNPILTQAHQLIYKAIRSNMQAVFTDCPHREKLGWLEQDHLCGPGLLYNLDLTTYYPKLMQDMADAQYADGRVPTTAPEYVVFAGPGLDVFADSPEWGSAIVMVPFMYRDEYGDDLLIRQYYRQMRHYVDYLTSRSEGGLIDFGLGDWYDYDGEHPGGFSRLTPIGLVASAHYYMDLCYMVEAARIVGNAYDATYFATLAEDVKAAFNDKYYDPATHQYGTGSQCSYALPLFLDMVPAGDHQAVTDNLVNDIRAHGTRLTTGDVGNRYLFQALARGGLNELMYEMNNHEEAPGYGFQLKFGATTLTEQWDPRQGSSWNHFMMGQIDEWLFATLAGIQPGTGGIGLGASESGQGTGLLLSGGYQHLTIAPQPVGDLTQVSATHDTPYGQVAIDWTRSEGKFTLTVNIPTNCTASIFLPGEGHSREVKSGKHTLSVNNE